MASVKERFKHKVSASWILLAFIALSLSLLPKGNLLGESVQEEKREPFPSLVEAVPRAEEVAKRSSEVRGQLDLRAQAQELEKRIKEAESRLTELSKKIKDLGDPNKLDFQRLLDARSPLEAERKSMEAYLALISGRLAELDNVRKEWEELRSFWAGWKRSVTHFQGDLPVEAFDKAERAIKEVIQDVNQRMGVLVAMQEQLGKLLEENRRLSGPLEAALARMREETFRRTEPPIVSQKFLLQLRETVASEGKESLIRGLRKLGESLALEEGMVFSQMVVFVLILGFLLWKEHGRARKLETLAMAVFAVGILSSFMGDTGGVIKAVERCLFSLAVGILWTEGEGRSQWRGALLGLGVSMGVMDILRNMGFPPPLCRIFLVGVSSGGLFFLLSTEKETRLQARAFSLGACVLALVLIAEVAGFANLADRLFRASAWSIFLVLTGWILLRFLAKGIDRLMELSWMRESKVVAIVGPFLRKRILVILAVGICLLLFLRILPVWGIYSSWAEAWERLVKADLSIGRVSLNVGLVILAALTVYLAFSLSRIVNTVLHAEVFPRKEVDPGARHAMGRLLHYFLVVVGFLMALSLLGVQLESFLVLGGALGVGIGFGLQHVANNFISGLILLFERPIKVGDTVVVEKEWGKVKRIGLRSTVIETFDRSELIVPNSQLVSSTVVNWTLSNPMARIRIKVGVAYGTDLEKALRLLVEAARKNPRVLEDPSPTALMMGFGESSMDLELHAWVGDIKERLVAQSEICKEIQKLFKENGIEIPYPQRDIHLRSSGGHGCFPVKKEWVGQEKEP